MVTLEQVWEKLHQRPGRGGVRLSHQEAEYIAGLLKAAVERTVPKPVVQLTPEGRREIRLLIDQRKRELMHRSGSHRIKQGYTH